MTVSEESDDRWQLWSYRAQIDRVVDGDTLDTRVDLGFGVLLQGDEGRVRLIDIDTAEIYGTSKDSDEYQEGIRHKRFVESWVDGARDDFEGDWPFLIRTYRGDERGKYGRYLARIASRATGEVLNDELYDEFGTAVEP